MRKMLCRICRLSAALMEYGLEVDQEDGRREGLQARVEKNVSHVRCYDFISVATMA